MNSGGPAGEPGAKSSIHAMMFGGGVGVVPEVAPAVAELGGVDDAGEERVGVAVEVWLETQPASTVTAMSHPQALREPLPKSGVACLLPRAPSVVMARRMAVDASARALPPLTPHRARLAEWILRP